MNDQDKQKYLEGYKKAKEKGVSFFPDIIFKDVLVSLVVFVILVALAYFIGAPLEERANPADTSYTPKPEWYFLFLFQLLKYFPGDLEVIGVFIIPSLAILLLILLPLLDRSPRRHFLKRPVVTGTVALLSIGVVFLTVQSIREAPPPASNPQGDPVAALYTSNCAPCHGPSIAVPSGANLHDIIAQGQHEGMPAWSADLTTDEIDALAGFILSPGGSQLFDQNCQECHEVSELVASDPLELKNALEQGIAYPPHVGLDIPDWGQDLSRVERTSMLNFLIAPDGQRLFAINCSPCHGRSVPLPPDSEDLSAIIAQGGLHLEMPSWRERLSGAEIDSLTRFVINPADEPDAQALFDEHCIACHGDRVPTASDFEDARQVITFGGAHTTMPVWGDVLTQEQLDALVSYTLQAASGTSVEAGQRLFTQNCAVCHGDLGEGGPNPALRGDIIAPISTAEFLKTRDDFTLRSIISQGQPNFGMSPFGSAFGGPLEDEDIDAIIAYFRSWEQNPPVDVPPVVEQNTVSLEGAEVYTEVCAQCHGEQGEGIVAPSLRTEEFQNKYTDQQLFDSINLGHEASAMIGWGEILSSSQIQQLVDYIRQFESPEDQSASQPTPAAEEAAGMPTFVDDILPIFEERCAGCHGSMGRWSASSYEDVMTTGANAPVVIPGNAEESLLVHKISGTQTEGNIMPPDGKMREGIIQLIKTWIDNGAPEE